MLGTVYLVATPIGNLQDISLRALETLKTVDLIACEDTRHTRKLLTHFGILNKTVSYHEHNETARADEFARLLLDGKSIAVVSDAGTPAVCDPSFRIVEKAHESARESFRFPARSRFSMPLSFLGCRPTRFFSADFCRRKKASAERGLKKSNMFRRRWFFTKRRIASPNL
jgi:16S rRNA (cytidine1402-2'-O)-methyltransferase